MTHYCWTSNYRRCTSGKQTYKFTHRSPFGLKAQVLGHSMLIYVHWRKISPKLFYEIEVKWVWFFMLEVKSTCISTHFKWDQYVHISGYNRVENRFCFSHGKMELEFRSSDERWQFSLHDLIIYMHRWVDPQGEHPTLWRMFTELPSCWTRLTVNVGCISFDGSITYPFKISFTI